MTNIRQILQRTQAGLCVGALWLCAAVFSATVHGQAQKPYPRYEPAPQPRLEISPGSATLTAGQPVSFTITRRGGDNKPAPVNADTPVQLILTTLAKLEDAKKQLGEPRPALLKALDQQTLSLGAGHSVARLEGLLLNGHSDVTVKVAAPSTGQARLFAECAKCALGEAVLAVVAAPAAQRQFKLPLPKTKARVPFLGWANNDPREAFVAWVRPALWQPPPPVAAENNPLINIVLVPPDPAAKPRSDRDEREYDFRVRLYDASDPNWVAPRDIIVDLKVLQGAAVFAPSELTINAGSAIGEVKLRSKVSGEMKLVATSAPSPDLSFSAAKLAFPFTFRPSATKLYLWQIGNTALANNLDTIQIDVYAAFDEDNQTYPNTAGDEAMPERRISFSVEPSLGVRFENGQSAITLPLKEDTGHLRLYSSLPTQPLTIRAQARNGQGAVITGELKGQESVSFKLPQKAIVFALIGGLVWGVGLWLLSKVAWGQGLFRGGVGGFVFYILIFFGAVAAGYLTTLSTVVTVAKLPTASWPAAFALGLIGGKVSDWLFGPAGKLPVFKPATNRPAATG